MSVHHMHVVPVGQRWVLDSLELESYRVVSHHRERVGSGDKCWESQVLCAYKTNTSPTEPSPQFLITGNIFTANKICKTITIKDWN